MWLATTRTLSVLDPLQPVSKHQRKEHARAADRAYQQAETALVAAAAEAKGGARAAVAELGRVCAQRSGLREAVYAPKLATAVAGVLSADPTLEDKITDYVQTHGVVMMLKLRGVMLSKAIKVGFENAAAKSEAAQEYMRLDPTLKAGGAVVKVGFDDAAAKSEQGKNPDDSGADKIAEWGA